jgi:dihydroxyacetone kinase
MRFTPVSFEGTKMTYLYNDPTEFADEFLDGFVAANASLVRRVPGGVARRTSTPAGEVAIVVGGGSGHYPGFAGLVGPGMAHGAAAGGVFASPSAQRVYSVARAVAGEAGVLLSYGNYAGDVLNFDQAQRRLIAEGIPCRTVVVTDDIFSASPDERGKRRGIAGDLVVFKAAGHAAASGASLDEVWAAANHANERTRSFGVAFTGCTLPGASEPLFTVPTGRMAIGMGIHGEPGIDEVDIPTADRLAALLVDKLLDELPDGVGAASGSRVGVVLNGLGGVKYEELFVTYRSLSERLAAAGVEIVEPEVGELVTSFQMAGVSLTLVWLDDSLAEAWQAPAWSPAYRKGAMVAVTGDSGELAPDVPEEPIPDASDDSRVAASLVVRALDAMASVIDANVDNLGHLDAIAGDGDHGIGMQRGVIAGAAAAATAADSGAGAGTVLLRAGDAWADRAGGTSGALWGLILRALGEAIGDSDSPTASTVAHGLIAGRDEVMRYGKAQLGDKTLLDALTPFAESLEAGVAAGQHLATAWPRAAVTAKDAAAATAQLLPRIGRARPHQEKSIGTPDPGAVSLAMIAQAVADVITEETKERV